MNFFSDETKKPAPVFDVFNVYFDMIYEPTMHILLEFDGRLNEKIFHEALIRYIESDPYLSSQFIEINNEFFWKKISESKIKDCFFLKENSGDAGNIFESALPPLDVYSGPQIRGIIYRNDSQDFILLSCHHGFCDAGGLKLMAKELFFVYKNLIANPKYRPEYKGWYYRGTDKILKGFSDNYLKIVSENEKPFSDKWAFPYEKKGRGTPKTALRTLNPKRLEKIKEFGKNNNATVNDIIIGAFFLALLKINSCNSEKGYEKSILTSADIRKYYGRDKENYPANLSVAFELSLYAKQSSELKDIIIQITEITKKLKSGDLGLGCIIFYEDMFLKGSSFIKNFFENMILSYDKTNFKNPVFSNTGIINSDDYSEIPKTTDAGFNKSHIKDTSKTIDLGNIPCRNGSDIYNKSCLNVTNAWFLPVICWPPGFLMTVSTFKNSLSLICGYEQGPYSKEKIEDFLEYVDDILPK